MTSPGEEFVLQLARASRKANRYVRHLQRADREDIIAAALLWCWKNRASYSLTTTLDTWFVNAVRDAYKAWQNYETRSASLSVAEIPTGDTTLAAVEAQSAANALAQALPPEYKRVALMQARGLTREEMMEKGATKHIIDDARARIKQLRKLLPDAQEFRAVLIKQPVAESDEAQYPASNIDHEIAALDFPPATGKECPPCWRCKWFEGYMPGNNRSVRMEIQEADVREAVRATEAEKVRIAGDVRNGNL